MIQGKSQVIICMIKGMLYVIIYMIQGIVKFYYMYDIR